MENLLGRGQFWSNWKFVLTTRAFLSFRPLRESRVDPSHYRGSRLRRGFERKRTLPPNQGWQLLIYERKSITSECSVTKRLHGLLLTGLTLGSSCSTVVMIYWHPPHDDLLPISPRWDRETFAALAPYQFQSVDSSCMV
jgi:hypothetical protein